MSIDVHLLSAVTVQPKLAASVYFLFWLEELH
jgi:hypothetical protein